MPDNTMTATADTAGSDKAIMNQISMSMQVSNGDPQDMFQLIRALLDGRDAELEININFI